MATAKHAVVPAAPPSAMAPGLTREQVDLIRDTVARGATDDELRMFLYQCQRLGMDPMLRQVHWVKRPQEIDGQWKSVGTMLIGIDGLRLAARRTGELTAVLGPQWCGPDGQWVDVWLAEGPPAAARVGVNRTGMTETIWGVARWETYCQRKRDGTPARTWERMPDLMLAKSAEAMALRRAFPDALSGVHADEELPLPAADDGPEGPAPDPAPATLADRVARTAEALAAPTTDAPPPPTAPPPAPSGPPAASPKDAKWPPAVPPGPTLRELTGRLEAAGWDAARITSELKSVVGNLPSTQWTREDTGRVRRHLAGLVDGLEVQS